VKKEKKLWGPLKAWKAHEWVPMKEAWLRVHAALSENMRLTQRDLKEHLLAKRLAGAARVIAPDESERCIIFEPTFWGPVELPYAYLVSGFQKHAGEGEAWHFFVRRAELDKHYPIAATPTATATTTVGHRSDDMRPPRRRPGPPPDTERWWGICAEIALRCIDPKTGRVNVPESENKLAEDVLDWLVENEQGQPSASQMRDAVKYVCAALRPLQR
jgi:hypothetical protein